MPASFSVPAALSYPAEYLTHDYVYYLSYSILLNVNRVSSVTLGYFPSIDSTWMNLGRANFQGRLHKLKYVDISPPISPS